MDPMRTDSLIALRIGQKNPASVATLLRPVLDRSLAVLTEAIETVDSEAVRRDLAGRLTEFRTALSTGADLEHIGPLTHACFEMYEHAVQTLQTQQHERHAELRRLVALVRDTVTMLIGDGDAFS